MAGGKDKRKEKYRVMLILLLMKCIRILLRKWVRKIAIQKTPDGESEWTLDDYLCHNKKRIERKLLKIDSNDRYRNILFPFNSKEKTEAGKWDLTLYIFILNEIIMIKGRSKSYMQKILDIRNDICEQHSSGVTRSMCKLYKRRIRKTKNLLYKNIGDKDLKKTTDRQVHNIEKGKMLAPEVEKVLDRWKDLESEKSKTGQGESGIARFFTVDTMLSEVCCEVMQALVRRSVRDLHHRCLDSFLRHYEKRIRRQIGSLDKWGRATHILLPKNGETKISEWDISLLCWVLLNLCYLGDITVHDSPVIADAVGRFRTIRNEITHKQNKSLSKDEYNSKMEHIRRSIKDCLDFLGDADLSENINDQIEDIENGDTEKEETMRRCKIAYQNTCTEHELEKKYLEDKVNIQRQLSEIVAKFKGVSIPGSQLELIIEGCGQHHSQMLSSMLVAKINETITGRQSIATVENDEMTRAITNLIDTWKSKGWNLISSEEGSVLLDIKCTSFNAFCDLYDTYKNDGSTLHVSEIEDAVQHVTGTRVKLHFIMYDVEMFKCMESIVCTLLENISHLTTTKQKYGIGNGSRINILMTPDARGCNGSVADISSLTSEDIVGQLSHLADILKKQNGLTSCSIRVNSHDYCIHPQSPEMQCIGPNEDDQNETMAWTSTDDEQVMSWESLSPDENCMADVQNSIQPSKDLELLGQEQEYSFSKLIPLDKQLGQDTPLHKQLSLDTKAEKRYETLKEDLREDLIDLYREEYHTLPLSPLLEENDTPLLEFYVIPDIESVEIQRAHGGGKEARSKVTSLHDVFYKEKEPCCKIYLTADAGFGKTALSKRLVLTWCQAKNCIPNEDEHFKKEDISTMSNFDFVFLLSLRDCSEEGDIDEMIKKQIINDLAYTISTSDFENILSKERCLIILDGLDEFTHAKRDIPHRRARRTCTILTTTRPWKLGVSKIRASEIERRLELVGLSKSSARRLKRSVISLLWGETDIKKHIQEFDRAVSERDISDLETVPLLLVYLLCLWCDETDLGKSRTELYCQIANLLLKRTFEKYPDMKQPCEQHKSDIPQCISRNEHCRKHYNLLNALGRLAFETLFDETKDQNLVFDMAVAEKCLSDKDLLQLSRHSGIITHDKDQTKINKQMQKTSFSHATVQEFFAALYISVSWDQEEVQTKVLSFCHCVARILAMSKVFVFISGINATVFSSMSKDLMKVISEDKITREYRMSTTGYYPFEKHPLKGIQDMYISCMKENTSDKELKLFCQDFFFSEDCKEEKCFTYLAQLAGHNKINMASINIDSYHGRSLREIIDCCELHELFQINKIYYLGEVENAQLRVLLDKSSKCVTVQSSDPPGSWSREMLETLQNNSLLQAIFISDFKMSHDVLNDFLNYIINRKTMTEIGLRGLRCTEHGRSCTFSLDFSQHSDLRKLDLCEIPEVSQLKVNSQVKHVKLRGINLGERSLPPEMANIESVDLVNVNMSASTLRDLVKVVEKLSHKVTVTIDRCKIEPETEFEHVKQDIHSSQNFRVTKDDSWEFVFETKDES